MSDHGFDAIYRQVNMANWLPRLDLPGVAHHARHSVHDDHQRSLHYTLDGTLSGSSDREAFIDKFQDVQGAEGSQTGLCPFEHVYRREDIYNGRMMEKAPDVIFDETAKYYVTRGVPDSVGVPVFQDVWTTSFSAYHRPEGIIAVRGPQVKHSGGGSLRERLARGGDFQNAKILDVMPTLLALMRQPIPDDVDGRVLTEAIDPGFLAEHPPRVEPV
jgi:predicted AlkP superfamily phosphohydrolase/phosphomutase